MSSTPKFYDRVLESSSTTGTGTYTLAGAITGFQTFAAVGNSKSCTYCAYEVDANGNPSGGWEVGRGTYTTSGTTLSRTTILASTNSNAAVSWAAGTRRIALVSPAALFTGRVSVKEYGATGDGSTDDTAAIQAAIDAVNAEGGGTVFVPYGTYMINANPSGGVLYLKSNVQLQMDFLATLKAITNALDTYNIVMAVGISNCGITGGVIQGERSTHTGGTGEWGHGFDSEASTNVWLSGVTFKDCWGDGVYVSDNGNTATPSVNVMIARCRFDNCRRNGLSGINWNGGAITDCVFNAITGTAPQAGIDFEPNSSSQAVRGISVSGNVFTGCVGHGFMAYAANGDVRNCHISGNVSTLNTGAGFWLSGINFCDVSGNSSEMNSQDGMNVLGAASYNTFTGNRLRQNNQANSTYSNLVLAATASHNVFSTTITTTSTGTKPVYGINVSASGCTDNVFHETLFGSVAFGTGNFNDAGTRTIRAEAMSGRYGRLESATGGADAAQTMVTNTSYTVDISGYTADRTYTLPATAAVGDEVEIVVTAGNTTKELIITAASGDTLNGISGGTEWSRLMMAYESVRMRCVVANATWIVIQDRRIPAVAVMTLSTSADGESAATFTRPTQCSTAGVWTATKDNASQCSVSGDSITLRRPGTYRISMHFMTKDSIADGQYASGLVANVADTVEYLYVHTVPGTTVAPTNSDARTIVVAADEVLRYTFRTQAGGLGAFANAGGVSCNFVAVEDLLA